MIVDGGGGRRRRGVFALVVTGFGALCVVAGRMGDVSLRDPAAVAVLVGMLVGWFAVLWLGSAS